MNSKPHLEITTWQPTARQGIGIVHATPTDVELSASVLIAPDIHSGDKIEINRAEYFDGADPHDRLDIWPDELDALIAILSELRDQLADYLIPTGPDADEGAGS